MSWGLWDAKRGAWAVDWNGRVMDFDSLGVAMAQMLHLRSDERQYKVQWTVREFDINGRPVGG